ncbi:MAG: hypothetical protein M3040_15125, partial [Bacteroidota bacterium]|nr:hypothetical protein [Bacteroidota bacterium]
VEPFFKTFVPNEVADATKNTESIICLSAESRDAVDEMVAKAIEAGAKTYKEPQDHGFMYGHGYQDLDGHLWEIMCIYQSGVTRIRRGFFNNTVQKC